MQAFDSTPAMPLPHAPFDPASCALFQSLLTHIKNTGTARHRPPRQRDGPFVVEQPAIDPDRGGGRRRGRVRGWRARIPLPPAAGRCWTAVEVRKGSTCTCSAKGDVRACRLAKSLGPHTHVRLRLVHTTRARVCVPTLADRRGRSCRRRSTRWCSCSVRSFFSFSPSSIVVKASQGTSCKRLPAPDSLPSTTLIRSSIEAPIRQSPPNRRPRRRQRDAVCQAGGGVWAGAPERGGLAAGGAQPVGDRLTLSVCWMQGCVLDGMVD